MTDYVSRLRIPVTGSSEQGFYTKSGVRLAAGYDRIVIGDRGPYVEFDLSHLIQDVLTETDDRHHYYVELRTIPDRVKVYVQLRGVDYADYVPGKCYVSPFELYDESGNVLIEPLKHT